MGSTLQRFRFPALSIIILGILLVQLFAGFRHTNKWFPFMWYPMYGYPNYKGDRIKVHFSIFAITADGVRHRLDPEKDLDLGPAPSNFWRYEFIAKRLTNNELNRIPGNLRTIKQHFPSVTTVQVEDYPLIITDDGPKPAPRKILNSIRRAAIDRWAAR